MSARGSVREIGATCRRWTALLAVAALSACGSTAALPGSEEGSTTGKVVAIPGLQIKLGLQLQRLSSRGLIRAVTARLNRTE